MSFQYGRSWSELPPRGTRYLALARATVMLVLAKEIAVAPEALTAKPMTRRPVPKGPAQERFLHVRRMELSNS